MSIFYITQDKTETDQFEDKYDFAKFIDGSSDVPVYDGLKVKKIVNGEDE